MKAINLKDLGLQMYSEHWDSIYLTLQLIIHFQVQGFLLFWYNGPFQNKLSSLPQFLSHPSVWHPDKHSPSSIYSFCFILLFHKLPSSPVLSPSLQDPSPVPVIISNPFLLFSSFLLIHSARFPARYQLQSCSSADVPVLRSKLRRGYRSSGLMMGLTASSNGQ